MKNRKRWKENHRAAYKNVEMGTKSVVAGEKFTLNGRAIHESAFEKEAEKGHYRVSYLSHTVGRRNSGTTYTYQVEEDAKGIPRLLGIPTEKQEMQ